MYATLVFKFRQLTTHVQYAWNIAPQALAAENAEHFGSLGMSEKCKRAEDDDCWRCVVEAPLECLFAAIRNTWLPAGAGMHAVEQGS